MSDNGPRRLANKGFATLALHYFGDHDALPDELEGIPLSYVDAAADWLRDQEAVAGDRLALVGVSGAPNSRSCWAPVVSGSAPSSPTRERPLGHPERRTRVARRWRGGPHITAEKARDSRTSTTNPSPTSSPPSSGLVAPCSCSPGRRSRLERPAALRGRRRAPPRARVPHEFEHRTYDDVGHYVGTPYAPLGALGDETRQRATAHAGEDAWPLVLECLEDGLRE